MSPKSVGGDNFNFSDIIRNDNIIPQEEIEFEEDFAPQNMWYEDAIPEGIAPGSLFGMGFGNYSPALREGSYKDAYTGLTFHFETD